MRKVKSDEFGILYVLFIVVFSDYFKEMRNIEWGCEQSVFSMVKEEAEDVLFIFTKDRADKKIKREIFKRHYEAAKGAVTRSDICSAREHTANAIIEGYSFFYGKEFVELLKDETDVVRSLIKGEQYKSFMHMMNSSNKHRLIFESCKEGALGRFLTKGYISV